MLKKPKDIYADKSPISLTWTSFSGFQICISYSLSQCLHLDFIGILNIACLKVNTQMPPTHQPDHPTFSSYTHTHARTSDARTSNLLANLTNCICKLHQNLINSHNLLCSAPTLVQVPNIFAWFSTIASRLVSASALAPSSVGQPESLENLH